jgi:hypothetical protein
MNDNLAELAAMLEWLTRCAERGELAPTNAAIAERFEFASTSASADLIAELERRATQRTSCFAAKRAARERPLRRVIARAVPRHRGAGQPAGRDGEQVNG